MNQVKSLFKKMWLACAVSVALILSLIPNLSAISLSPLPPCRLGVGDVFVGVPYKTLASPAVYYISTACTKRPIRNPEIFFSHFDSWNRVQVTSESVLNAIPDDQLNFLPWGPRLTFGNGSLVKIIDDPRVYLLLNSYAYPIGTAEVFNGMGYKWNWIEDVVPEVIARYTKGSVIEDGKYPAGTTFLYPGSPNVYIIQSSANGQVKRHILLVDELRRLYRVDRLATLFTIHEYPNAVTLPGAPSAPVTVIPPVPVPNLVFGSQSVGITNPFALVSVASIGLPTVGQAFTDTVFGTTIRRVSVAPSSGSDKFERHEYSQLQAYNADNTLIMQNQNGNFIIRSAIPPYSLVFKVPGDINDVRWNPANPDELIHFDSNDVGSGNTRVVIQATNVRSGVKRDIATLDAIYQTVSVSISWEEISRDGRWLTALLNRTDGGQDFIAYDLLNKRMGARIKYQGDLMGGRCTTDGGGPNWVAPSPLGKYLVIQWNQDGDDDSSANCTGVEAFDIQTGQYVGHVGSNRQHSDMGVDEKGIEIYVAPYFGNSLLLTSTKFPGSANFSRRYDKVILDTDWYHMDHISCQGPAGMCVVDAGGEAGKPFAGEVYLVYTAGVAADNGQNANALVRRLAHHRSTSCDYRHQAQASQSRDGKSVIFASDWGNCASGAENYVIDLSQANLSAPAPTE